LEIALIRQRNLFVLGSIFCKEAAFSLLKINDLYNPATMYNFSSGLNSYLDAGAKTSLGVCLTERKH
jgi:hypothetical protein